MEWFNLDIGPIIERAEERGDIAHVRHRIRDFDPFSLRLELPVATQKVAAGISSGRGKVYIHCTAGVSDYLTESTFMEGIWLPSFL